MYCSHCGKKLSEDDFFCSNCGTKVIRHDVLSGNDEGQFDETLLFRPEDMKQKAVGITQSFSKPEQPVIEKFTWGEEDNSHQPLDSEAKNNNRVPWNEKNSSMETSNPSSMVDGLDTIKESRVQSAQAAERLRNRRTRVPSEISVVENSIEQTEPMAEMGLSDNMQERFVDKLKRFGKKSRKDVEDLAAASALSKEKIEADEDKGKKESRSNGMRTLVAGIVLIGLVVGIILGLFISKPWHKEEEALPENPTPLLTVTPHMS